MSRDKTEMHSLETVLEANELDSTSSLLSITKSGGRCNYYYNVKEKHILLYDLFSNTKGFGTDMMRCLMSKSIDAGYSGAIKVDAAWSSHLFYLFMGMMPKEAPVSYLKYFYGNSATRALELLSEITEDFEPISAQERSYFSTLSHMLREEKKIPQTTPITAKDLSDNSSFLQGLAHKKSSYIRDSFVPDLLKILEAPYERSVTSKYPPTNSLGGIIMFMSEDGKSRWRNAIEQNKPFISFKSLEQLYSFISEDQKRRLEIALKKIMTQSVAPQSAALGEAEAKAEEKASTTSTIVDEPNRFFSVEDKSGASSSTEERKCNQGKIV
jgi:hypothetical protein